MAIVARINPSAETAIIMMRRLRFFAAIPTRGTSIEERFGENPAGRTIVSSFGCRCGITVKSKLTGRATKLEDSVRRAEQWNDGGDDHGCEEKCFADKLTPRLSLKILAADIAKRRSYDLEALSLVPAECRGLITKVSPRKAVASVYGGWFHRPVE
jgi:hypothetical protein